MSKQEMIELVQQHHPYMGMKEIIRLLNRAKDNFCMESEVVEDTWTVSTAVDQRHYALDSNILKIKKVTLNDVVIPRLTGNLPIDDTTGTES
tara:strand:+ start:196 stop:471 length:276 start_codon:yes stop_codon:yes gene_type:complete